MTLKAITSSDDIASAAMLSTRSYERLRSKLPFLRTLSEGDFVPRIEWMTRKGIVMGLFETRRLTAYLGAFPMDNFRNAGGEASDPTGATEPLREWTSNEPTANFTGSSRHNSSL
jgi:hypothetical protein